MKIAFFEIEDWAKEFAQSVLKKHKLYFSKKPATKNNIPKDTETLAVFIYSKIDKQNYSSS